VDHKNPDLDTTFPNFDLGEGSSSFEVEASSGSTPQGASNASCAPKSTCI
jgi:hypothetical protein